MPEMGDFRIEFENPEASYKNGGTVIGKVILNLSKRQTISAIILETHGLAKTRWNSDTNRCYYDREEIYIREANKIFPDEIGDGQTTLPAGQHSFGFSVTLPVNIPSSFKHKYGKVKYCIKAVIYRPWKSNRRVESPITVVAPYNSSPLQNLTTSIHDEFEHKFRSWSLMSAGRINIDVKCQASTFTPGQTIELIININNKSRVDITEMQLYLVKTTKFQANNPFNGKIKTELLQEVQKNGHFDKRGETSLTLVVPPQIFFNLEHCSLIDIDYKLDLIIIVSGMHNNIRRQFPVQLLDTMPK